MNRLLAQTLVGLSLLFPTVSSAIDFYQAKEGAVAREEASPNAPIIYRFKAGEEFKVIGKEGEWLQIRFSTKAKGYAREADAALVTTAPAPRQAQEVPSASVALTSPAPVAPGITPQARDAIGRAIKALRLLAAATETGMNYQQYGTRLVDTKMEVEGAIGGAEVSVPTHFRTAIDSVFRLYQDAQLAWQWKIQQGRFCGRTVCSYSREDPLVSQLLREYPFLRQTILREAPGGLFLPNGEWAISRALALLWMEAKTRVD